MDKTAEIFIFNSNYSVIIIWISRQDRVWIFWKGVVGLTVEGVSWRSIVKAMTDYVEIEAEEAVEVNMSMDPEVGTIYSVAVPIKRVRPTFRRGEMASQGTSNSQWDPQDPDSDPADQFPWGT
eukprot:jgi/Picre1/34882/NNA_002348.t1